MRLAYFSPLHPDPSGISDYSEELLPHLAACADITVVTDGYVPTNREALARCKMADDRAYRAADYDLALYHLGNSPSHAYIYRRAKVEPGVIVLHEFVLHHLVAWMTLEHGDRAGYVAAMREAYGEPGARLGEQEALGLEGLNRFEYPLSEPLLKTARGVIAHSRYVAEQVKRAAPHVPVTIIPHEMPKMTLVSQSEARARLALATDAPLIGAFGNVGPTKRTSVLLEAFRALRRVIPNAQLLFVGAVAAEYDLRGLVDFFGVADGVRMTGKTSFDDFHLYMAAMDTCVALRFPTAGETSGAALRMMAQGKAVVVSRAGWFAELPDDAVAKIDVDNTETEMLARMLERLLTDKMLRAAMGTNARRYVESECAVEDAARGYARFLGETGGLGTEGERRATNDKGRATNDKGRDTNDEGQENEGEKISHPSVVNGQRSFVAPDFRDEVTRAYVELGLTENDAALGEVAKAIVELGLR